MFWVVKLLLYNLIPKLWITSATNAGDTPIFKLGLESNLSVMDFS